MAATLIGAASTSAAPVESHPHPLAPFFSPTLMACRLYLCNTGCAWIDYSAGCAAPSLQGIAPVAEAAETALQHRRLHLQVALNNNVSRADPAVHEENRCCCPQSEADVYMQRSLCQSCAEDTDPDECAYGCSPEDGKRERQMQCAASELWLRRQPDEGGGSGGEALLSQREAQATPRLSYEQNATEEVEWELLPTSGGLAENGLNGSWHTCAVVGSSSSLVGHGNGPLIDSHDQVIRINVPVLEGFAEDVGTRTTLQFFWGAPFNGGDVRRFDEAQEQLPPERRAVAIQAPSTKRDIDTHFAALREGREGKQPLVMLSGTSYHHALSWLCNASRGGRLWHNRVPRLRPSTGFFAVAFALDRCQNVSLFGFGDPPPCAPRPHYWDAPQGDECNASAAAPEVSQVETEEGLRRDGVGAMHWFDLEHRIYRSLREQERVGMHSTTNTRLLTPLSRLKSPASQHLDRKALADAGAAQLQQQVREEPG
jgi:hypothetical protein